MKKFLVLFISMLFAFAVSAQTYNLKVDDGTTYKKVTTLYTVTNTTAVNLIWQAGNDFSTKQDYLIHLDSVSGNHTNVAVALYGSKFGTTYSAIGSAVNWKGTTADTNIIISNGSATLWRYFKVVVTGTGTGVSRVSNQEFKLWQQ